ncbi:MAG TPA: 16S rRNA (uracil(1498)-N(3))-methyltransferase [Anaeromyxobacter sp.]|nr:16S rRNA (uracil(1498)-N(3))-methyltransferase [Anaeromyxobacter sp.]
MTLRRVHVPPDRIDGGRARLSPAARHYVAEVLRLAAGAAVEVFDGRGGRYAGRLEPGLETVAVGPREDARGAGAEIALLFALAKGEKTDLVVQKATELGAARILPFAAERSVVRLGPERGAERARRWRRIAEDAARQCGRADVPDVAAPLPLEAALAALAPGAAPIVFHPGGAPLAALAPPGPGGLAAVVGPEGGLTEAELAACERAGARRASLGPRVLRAETAAIVAVALLQARFGDVA